MKSSLGILAFLLLSQSAFADFLPNIKYFDNKLVSAWDNVSYADDINELPEDGDLIVDQDKLQSVNFERVARWKPAQIEYAVRAHHYLLKNGIDQSRGKVSKTLGAIGLITGYKYDVEPTYVNGMYTRSDVLAMRPVLNLKSTILNMKDYTVIAKANPGYEIEYGYYRQFSSPIKAVISKPYFHKNLPFDGKHALQGLRPGDIFNFKARLNMSFGTAMVTDLLTLTSGLSAGVHFIASGTFEVFVIRLPENKVQLRIMGSRRKTIGASASLGFEKIKVTGIGLADSVAGKLMGLDLITAKLEKKFNEGLIVDYIIDLADPAAIAAYDESLLKIREFNYMQVVDPRMSTTDFEEKMLLNVKALDNNGTQYVKRLFQLEHNGKSLDSEFTIGNKILQFRHNTHKSQNEFEDEADDDRTYVLNTKETISESSFLFSLRKKMSYHNASSLEIRDNGEEQHEGVILTADNLDKSFSAGDLKSTRSKLERMLPDVTKLLDFSIFENRKLESVGVKTVVHFTNESLLLFPEISKEEIQSAYKQYLKRFKVSDLIPSNHGNRHGPDQMHVKTLAVAKLLEKLGKKETSLEEKVSLMMKLCNLKLFKATGAGFFMSLLPTDGWKETMRVEMNINSTAGPGLQYSSGPSEHTDLFSSLTHFENMMNGDEIEFRLLIRSLSKVF